METVIAKKHLQNGNTEKSSEKDHSQSPPQKSIRIAYLLWLFGGIFGAHHLYLGNDLQAFIWLTTLGSYIGIRWISEGFLIPQMVREANEDPSYMSEIEKMMRTTKKPPFSLSQFLFAILVGFLWSKLFMTAIPQDKFGGIDWSYLHWLTPFVGSLGVYFVGNFGREKGVFWHCLLAAYITYPIRYVIYDQSYWLTITLAVSAFAFNRWSKEFDRAPRKRQSLKKRFSLLSTGLCIYLSVWVAFFYFNRKVPSIDGDEISVSQVIHDFFASSWWTDVNEAVHAIYQFAQQYGWYEFCRQLFEILNDDGEEKAYKVLGVLPTASQSEITSAWKTLSKGNHPDKVQDKNKKREAELYFMEIQQAYELLSTLKNKRHRKNTQFSDDL